MNRAEFKKSVKTFFLGVWMMLLVDLIAATLVASIVLLAWGAQWLKHAIIRSLH